MQINLIWWFLAGGLVMTELLTGTFYLLTIAMGCFAGGVTTWLGGSVVVQLAVAAIVMLGALWFLRDFRLSSKKNFQVSSDLASHFDLGAIVQITGWQGYRGRAFYRGTQWDVELAEGEVPSGLWYKIKAMHGNLLIVAAAGHNQGDV